jgi:hypothetical protein
LGRWHKTRCVHENVSSIQTNNPGFCFGLVKSRFLFIFSTNAVMFKTAGEMADMGRQTI